MNLDPDRCYRALRARDARFDGHFFVAVRSTGIYCRPICPAPTPRRENCAFVACAAAAQDAGFRPCLRCRPETAPGTPAWSGTHATVSRALQLIEGGALDDGSADDLAARLGVGERHLRRLFLEHVGAAPGAVARTRRLHFAKRLIDDTALAMTDVAVAAGFRSVRRFNAAVRDTWSESPSALRRRAGRRSRQRAARHGGSDHAALDLALPYRAPLSWDALLGFFAARAIPGMESVEGDTYRRTFSLGGHAGWIEVAPDGARAGLRARVCPASAPVLAELVARMRRLFDLAADPARVREPLEPSPRLRSILDCWPGLRVPGAWDGFEIAARAVLGQQVSVKGATTLAARLVQGWGPSVSPTAGDPAPGLDRAFPTPDQLADADLSSIGLTRARATTLRRLSSAVADGALALDSSHPLEDTHRALLEIPGIGEWTASYIAMRALADPDAFPTGDLVLRRALETGETLAPRVLAERAEAWRPWRAYAAIALWTAASAERRDAPHAAAASRSSRSVRVARSA